MKHKHADLIHAWADGAEIQYQNIDGWHDAPKPSWDVTLNWRIKPEEKKPVVRWLWAVEAPFMESGVITTTAFYSEEEMKNMNPPRAVKLEWSRTEFSE